MRPTAVSRIIIARNTNNQEADKMSESSDIFRTIFEKMSDPILLLKDGRFIDCNAATLKVLALSEKNELLNKTPSDISPDFQPDGQRSATKAAQMIEIAMQAGFHCFEWRHLRSDGSIIPVEVMLTPIMSNGEVLLHTLWRDISDRIKALEELRRSETKLRTLYDSTSDAVMLLNKKGFFDCNKSTLKIFGCATKEAFCAMHPADLSPARQPCGTQSMDLANQRITTAMETGSLHFEWVHQRIDTGESFPAEVLLSAMHLDGELVLQAVVRDITMRKEAEEEIKRLAFYDPLTHLPNRRLLVERLKLATASAQRTGQHGALMYLDFDNFKPINDTHGHEIGDLLLIEAAARLNKCMRETDTIARLGGDEFVVVLNELDKDKNKAIASANDVAEKILTTLSQPYVLTRNAHDNTSGTLEHRCTTSIGAIVFAKPKTSVDDILKWADAAMYQAKKGGRNTIRFYEN
jgi:diguanylate cyclase (GGDEF)-like protein/PAS domain S-box-containing protein